MMNTKQKATILLVLAAIVWGASFYPMAKTIEISGVFAYLFWRFLLASCVFALIFRKDLAQDRGKSLKAGLICGLCLAFGFALQTAALQFTLSSVVAFITGLYIVMVPFLSYFFYKHKLSLKAIILSLVALFGMYALSGAKGLSLGLGESLTAISALAYGLHIVFTSEYVKKCNLGSFVFYQFATLAILYFFIAFFEEKSTFASILNPWVLAFVLVSALVLTNFAFFAQSWSQKHIKASKVALILALEPITAAFVGFYFGELLSVLQIVGAALILLAVVMSEN